MDSDTRFGKQFWFFSQTAASSSSFGYRLRSFPLCQAFCLTSWPADTAFEIRFFTFLWDVV